MSDPLDPELEYDKDGVPNIADFHHKIVGSNVRLIGNLELLGHPVDPMLHIQAAVEAIIDMMFTDAESLAQFHCAVDTNLHTKLKQLLQHAK